MITGRYNNLGWFARHPRLYELGIVMLGTLRRQAARAVGPDGGMKVLDIACGTGGLSMELVRLKHEVTGIDLDPEMLYQASKKTRPGMEPSYIHGDASRLPFGDHCFDAATIAFAMHDVPYEIGVLFIKEAKRVLTSNGELTILDYNEPKKNIFAALLYPVAKLYESPNFSSFVKTGLDKYLEGANLVKSRRFTIFGGVQVVGCK